MTTSYAARSRAATIQWCRAPAIAFGVAMTALMIVPAIAQQTGSAAYVECHATLDRLHIVSGNPLVYGLAIRTQPNIRAVRVFINTERRSYAVTFADLDGTQPPGALRFMTLGDRSPVESAWIDRAGADASSMTGCSRPFPAKNDDGNSMTRRETFAADALERLYVPATPAIAATDVTNVPPSERCFAATTPPRVVSESGSRLSPFTPELEASKFESNSTQITGRPPFRSIGRRKRRSIPPQSISHSGRDF